MSASQPETLLWPGRPVSGAAGEPVGFCGAVLAGTDALPGWLLVYGLPGGQARVVPLDTAHPTADSIVLSVPGELVTAAPPVRDVSDLSGRGLDRQRFHYGLAAPARARRPLLTARLTGPVVAAVAGVAGGAAVTWRAGQGSRERAAAASRRNSGTGIGARTARVYRSAPNALGLVVLVLRVGAAWRRRRSRGQSRRRPLLVWAVVLTWRGATAATRLLRRLYRLIRARRHGQRRPGSSS